MGGMKGKPALPSPNAMKWVIAGVASPNGGRYAYHAKKNPLSGQTIPNEALTRGRNERKCHELITSPKPCVKSHRCISRC